MKPIFHSIFGISIPNEGPAPEDQRVLANEFKNSSDNWVQLSPYGDFPNPLGMQRFTKEDAEAIANAFKSSLNPMTRMLGLPWYVGHPDHPRFTDKYKDTRSYGRIKALEARPDGLFANVKWSEEGKRLIEQEAFAGHSVNWLVRKDGNVFRPFSLKSVGFTNEPNIPVQPITAANETTPPMKPLLDWLKKHQIELANEATEAQVAAALAQIDSKLASADNKLNAFESARSIAETALANEKANTTAFIANINTLTAEIANERKARAGMLLDAAIHDGRITLAERPAFETEFANEFTSAEAKLKGLAKKLNTQPPAVLGRLKAESRNNISQITSMVNERMEKEHVDYDEAFRRYKNENHPLFVPAAK